MKIKKEEKPNKLQMLIQSTWKYFFDDPLPLFKSPTLSNVPDVMEALFDDSFCGSSGRIHILILKKSFQISATDWHEYNLMVDAPHKDGIKYGAYWPFRFALLAFRKKMSIIVIELECKQERYQADMEKAMSAFLKKFERKKVSQGWRSSGKDDVSYTLRKNFMHGNTYEATFRKVMRWSETHYNWGYIV